MPGTSGLKMDAFGSVQVEETYSRYFAIGAKDKHVAGQSGIGVLVVGFGRIGALKKKHVPHIFSSTSCQQMI